MGDGVAVMEHEAEGEPAEKVRVGCGVVVRDMDGVGDGERVKGRLRLRLTELLCVVVCVGGPELDSVADLVCVAVGRRVRLGVWVWLGVAEREQVRPRERDGEALRERELSRDSEWELRECEGPEGVHPPETDRVREAVTERELVGAREGEAEMEAEGVRVVSVADALRGLTESPVVRVRVTVRDPRLRETGGVAVAGQVAVGEGLAVAVGVGRGDSEAEEEARAVAVREAVADGDRVAVRDTRAESERVSDAVPEAEHVCVGGLVRVRLRERDAVRLPVHVAVGAAVRVCVGLGLRLPVREAVHEGLGRVSEGLGVTEALQVALPEALGVAEAPAEAVAVAVPDAVRVSKRDPVALRLAVPVSVLEPLPVGLRDGEYGPGPVDVPDGVGDGVGVPDRGAESVAEQERVAEQVAEPLCVGVRVPVPVRDRERERLGMRVRDAVEDRDSVAEAVRVWLLRDAVGVGECVKLRVSGLRDELPTTDPDDGVAERVVVGRGVGICDPLWLPEPWAVPVTVRLRGDCVLLVDAVVEGDRAEGVGVEHVHVRERESAVPVPVPVWEVLWVAVLRDPEAVGPVAEAVVVRVCGWEREGVAEDVPLPLPVPVRVGTTVTVRVAVLERVAVGERVDWAVGVALAVRV